MVEHLPIPVVLTDADGYVVGASALAATVLSSSSRSDRLHLERHLAGLSGVRPSAERMVIKSDAGEHGLVVLGAAPSPVTDIDTAAAGAAALAGEIAHDFNNLLGVIINYTTLAAADAEDGSQQSRDLAEVLAASRRAAEIADRLRRMSVAGQVD